MSHYDAVVVGAGPAGSSAALHMARNGMQVLLLERGNFPGNKNMFGGVIYAEPTGEIVPEFWREAPLERVVTRDNLWLLDNDSVVELGFTGLRFAKNPYNKITTMRPHFDRWLAGKAVEAGAVLLAESLVTNLYYEKKTAGKGPVRGVILDDGSVVQADVVILAEGVNAALTKKAGLAKKADDSVASLWVREVISLPAEKLEDRFLLEKDEGAVLAMVGYPTAQVAGLAGLFTNRESVSLTLGMSIRKIKENRTALPDLLARLKAHPYLRRLLAGGKSEAYAAHMIPQGGKASVPKLYSDGLLVVGDAAALISGRRGSDLAMLSGKAAAETAVQARTKQDYSAKLLRGYHRKLQNSFYLKNINQAANNVQYDEKHGDADYLLTTVANDLAYEFFRIGMDTDEEKTKRMTSIVLDKQSPVKSLFDLLSGLQNWGVV